MHIVTELYDAVYILEGGGLMQGKEAEEEKRLVFLLPRVSIPDLPHPHPFGRG